MSLLWKVLTTLNSAEPLLCCRSLLLRARTSTSLILAINHQFQRVRSRNTTSGKELMVTEEAVTADVEAVVAEEAEAADVEEDGVDSDQASEEHAEVMVVEEGRNQKVEEEDVTAATDATTTEMRMVTLADRDHEDHQETEVVTRVATPEPAAVEDQDAREMMEEMTDEETTKEMTEMIGERELTMRAKDQEEAAVVVAREEAEKEEVAATEATVEEVASLALLLSEH